ncbi:MAG: hypothetical protein HZA64_14780 [Rhodocyclales bacterium]|nr:hypothetical protein [Rhodocyclales bacterium]
MTTLESFSRRAAKKYLQNIVFVDDEIYAHLSGKPVVDTEDLPSLKSPFLSVPAAIPAVAVSGDIEAPEDEGATNGSGDVFNAVGQRGQDSAMATAGSEAARDEPVPYHPKRLVESFAKEGMVCALYEPVANFATDCNSDLFKLCERADVVILDWDLFQEDGRNILPLIQNLVDQSQNSVPHRSSLCVIYTTRPDLARVASAIYDHLQQKALTVQDVHDRTTLVAGATRIIVLGKPNVPGRPEEQKSLEVLEENLAERVIDEFARMHSGILPSYALYGMASVRHNSKKILDKFHSDQDGPFLLHRALLLEKEDAFEQLPELIAEEVLAVMLDNQLDSAEASKVARDACAKLNLSNVTWPAIDGKKQDEREKIARTYLGGGLEAAKSQHKVAVKDMQYPARLHASMGCDQTFADKKLAALFSLRTNYFESDSPALGFGTVVRWRTGDNLAFKYGLCLMPVCDSVRLKSGDNSRTSFPFWELKTSNDGGTTRGIVVPIENGYLELFASGKPRDMLWIDRFAPATSGMVLAKQDGNSKTFYFIGDAIPRLEWVAQLKPSHAQRVAHDIGHSFSRVGVLEAEWLRLKTEGKS